MTSRRRVIRRQRRRGVGQRQHRERRGQQRAALDPAGQPRRQRRADAQHDRAEGDQQSGVADGDAEVRRQFDQHARRRQHGTAGDDIAEHQCGGSEAASGAGTFGQVFHAIACRTHRHRNERAGATLIREARCVEKARRGCLQRQFFSRCRIAPRESPAIPLLPAYLRSFAGVSHRRLPCLTTRTSPRQDSSTASRI